MLNQAARAGRQIHFLPPYRPENQIKLFEWLGVLPAEQQETSSVVLINGVVNQRNYKSEEEIIEIKKAANTSVDMHTLGMRLAKPCVTESRIAAAVQEVSREGVQVPGCADREGRVGACE